MWCLQALLVPQFVCCEVKWSALLQWLGDDHNDTAHCFTQGTAHYIDYNDTAHCFTQCTAHYIAHYIKLSWVHVKLLECNRRTFAPLLDLSGDMVRKQSHLLTDKTNVEILTWFKKHIFLWYTSAWIVFPFSFIFEGNCNLGSIK